MTRAFSDYDKRHYETVDVLNGYSQWSQTYDMTVSDQLDLALLSKLASPEWHTIDKALDLACGTGRIGAWLKQQGVGNLTGVDLSEEMLAWAKTKDVYDELVKADITSVLLSDNSYDLIVTSLAVCHLPELLPLYKHAASLTQKAGAKFVLLDYHPFFLINGIPTHFAGSNNQQLAIQNYVHLISDHVKAANQTGWRLVEMEEQVVDDKFVAQRAAWTRHLHLPVSFVMVWERT